ncbi:MAG: nucleotide exchange factor GrpE [Xenococcaceae cyanobacterium]
MSQSSYRKNSQLLQQLMQQVGISNLRQLSRISGVSELQLIRLQYGLMPKMQIETLLKLSEALQVPVSKLLTMFSPESILPSTLKKESSESAALASLKQEYQRLQQQIEKQRESLSQEFQQSSLQVLESWLLQWPTATAAAQKNPQLPAVRLLPLVKPVEQLLKQWGVEAIASVGEELPYDPQWHQLMEGTAQPGDMVKVRYIGYRQGEKLLYRAKVSPLKNLPENSEV